MNIEGLREAQEALRRAERYVSGAEGMQRVIGEASMRAHRYAVGITHVDTGALKNAHRMRLARTHAEIYIDPGARNEHGGRPAQYGPIEESRGGSHAFYRRTIDEAGPDIVRQAQADMARYLR